MYLNYFNLKEFPFRLTPDADFLYMSAAHSRAKAYMDYTIWNRDGFVVITGEVGSGKTTLLQKLISELDDSIKVAKIFQTQLDDVEFLQAVLVEFGLNPFNAKKVELIDMLNQCLLDHFGKMKQLVLIVDDAHNLSPKVLEEVRMLSGLETRKQKILHVILVGQPELNERLEGPGMEQLLQRVRLRFHLKPLSEDEMTAYIDHRLRIAGANQRLFTADAMPVIFKYTGGVPRLINTLGDTALTCAYADEQKEVNAATATAAIKELQWLPYARRVNRARGQRPELLHTDAEVNAARLSAIEHKLQHVEAAIPPLTAIVKHMAEINTSLKEIASALRKTDDPTVVPRKLVREK